MHALALAGLLALASEATALMPPHVNHTVPASGETLQGEVIVFHGYSLRYADDEEVVVTDLTADAPVEHASELVCEWEGEDPPGHVGGRQQRCELKVTLRGLEAGHRYRASYMDTEIEFAWSGPAQSAPPDPEPATIPEAGAEATD